VTTQQPPSLQRPDHLDTSPPPPSGRAASGAWLLDRAAGLASLLLGTVAFILVTVSQHEFWTQPSWRLTVPFFIVTLAVTAIAFIRKEKSHALPLLGLGLAAATLVLGWFFLVAAVVVATGLVILVLSHAM
jgi:hypothetical protein